MKRHLHLGVVLRLWLYRILFPITLVFLLPGMIRRMVKRGNFRRNLGQRFGYFSEDFQKQLEGKKTIWLQSISVGETQVALKIARTWLVREPDLQIIISVTTSTGYDLAYRSVGAFTAHLHVIYNPIDLASIVRRSLDAVRPSSLVLVEGAWPVLLCETWKRGIPVSLVARLSPRSARRFARFRWFAGPIFELLDAVFVQEPEEKLLWQNLGAKPTAIHCGGAIKYDEPPAPIVLKPELATILGERKNHPILLAGSTFPGEEILLVQTFLKLRETFPELFLILVPRHVERTPEIVTELTLLNLKVALRTAPQHDADLLIVNTTGELRDWYAFATVVFIGKSLTSTGGQNPVEPALLGKPVVFGPHMENFAPIVRQWLQTDAAIQVADATELAPQIATLLANPSLRETLANRAITAITTHFGATERVVQQLSPLKL